MEGLNIYLPPFSPDYSGVASVFLDLKCLTVLHDASGCTANYTGYDEPRWYGSHKAVYSSGLREIDVVFGNEDKFIRNIKEAAATIQPEVITMVGSPVPMVMGTDMRGVMSELEEETGIPSFGFDTTGLDHYNKGVSLAFMALAKRFMKKSGYKIDHSVNILGLTPLDFGNGCNAGDIKIFLEQNGWTVLATLMMDSSLEQLRRAPQASVNLVVSQSGLDLAEWMYKRFQIPYVIGTPMGTKSKLCGQLEHVEKTGISIKNVDSDDSVSNTSTEKQPNILWIGEQVIGNSMRQILEEQYGTDGMTIGCIFGIDKRIARTGDRNLDTETAILREINSGKYRVLIGDPLMKKLVRKPEIQFFEMPQVAVSSKLHWNEICPLIDADTDAMMEQMAKASICKNSNWK